MIRLAVIAPSQALRAGLRTFLSADPLLCVQGEAASLDAYDGIPEEVDVWVLAGNENILPPQQAFLNGSSLLLLSENPAELQLLTRLSLRGWGLLSPDSSPEELTAAVRALYEGLVVSDPALLKLALDQPKISNGEAPALILKKTEALTRREKEVLQHLAQGKANKQISLVLGISEHTVKFHVSAIYTKLGVTNRAEAVRQGIQSGIIVL